VPGLDGDKLRGLLLARSGAIFDGNALDKSSDVLAVELAKLGFPFAQALPRTTRDAAAKRIDVVFTIEYSVRAAQMAVYELLKIKRAVPAITRHDKSFSVLVDTLEKAFA